MQPDSPPGAFTISTSQTHATLLARLGESASSASSPAWREFVDRYGDLIRAFCRRHGLQASDMDDVFQDVLLSLSKAMPGFTYTPSLGKFRSYLKTVVLHAIYRKTCQKRPGVLLGEAESLAATASGDPATDAQWEQEWRQHHLRRALSVIDTEFSSRDRVVFERYALAGEAPEQIAREASLSVEAVYQIKSRITRRLSQLIAAQVADEG